MYKPKCTSVRNYTYIWSLKTINRSTVQEWKKCFKKNMQNLLYQARTQKCKIQSLTTPLKLELSKNVSSKSHLKSWSVITLFRKMWSSGYNWNNQQGFRPLHTDPVRRCYSPNSRRFQPRSPQMNWGPLWTEDIVHPEQCNN